MKCHRREKTQRLIDRAARLLTIGDATAAAKLATQAVRLAPGHDRARLVHAEAMLAINNPDEALHTLSAAGWYDASGETEAIRPADLAARHVLRAEAHQRLGHPDEAAELLIEAVALDPSNHRAVRRLAALRIEQGKPREAIESLKRIADPPAINAHTLRLFAEAYEAAGDEHTALRYYRQVTARRDDPTIDLVAIQLRIARLLTRTDHIADAQLVYDNLLRQHPEDIDLHIEAADLAVRIGDDARAVKLLAAALEVEPDHPRAATRLADQHMRAGRFKSAARLWHRLRTADPSRIAAHAGLIVCALCDERRRLADRLLEDFRERFDASARQTALSRAWRIAIPGRMLNQPSPRAESPRANVLTTLLADAAQTLDRAAEQHPDHADVHYHRAVCREAMGQHDAAEAGYHQALSINPGYLDAARRRITMHLQARAHDAAAALLATVRRVKPDTTALCDLEATLDVIRDHLPRAARRLRDAGYDRTRLQHTAETVTANLHRFGVDPNRIHQWRGHCRRLLGVQLHETQTARAA